MKRLISITLALAAALSLAACGTSPAATSNVTSSAGLDKYATWLDSRIPDGRDVFVGDASDGKKYGIDMADFQAEGYVIRSIGGETVVIGKDTTGVDRAVHDLARHADEIGYENTYNEGYRVKRMTLAGVDISEYAVVIPADADENVRFAAEQLRDYTSKACGVVLPIQNNDAAHMIKFVKDESGSHGVEGFTIATTDGQMTITHGIWRGALFGALEFIEQYEGWRFVPDLRRGSKGSIDYLYESEHVDIPAGISDTQLGGDGDDGMTVRSIYGAWDNANYLYKVKYTGEMIERSAKFGGYGLVRKACHGLQNSGLGLIMQNGQVCFTDEENIETVTDWVAGQIDWHLRCGETIGREFTDVDIAQYDGTTVCPCKNCRKIIANESSQCASMLSFANTIAETFEESAPGLYFSVLIYCNTICPPVKMKPHKMLNLSYCFYIDAEHGGWVCMNHPYDASLCPERDGNYYFAQMFEKWCTYGCRVDIWYYGEMYYPCVPTPDFSVMYDNMQYMIEHGADGIFWLNAGEYYEYLEGYLAARLLWNCHMSYEEYLDLIREVFVINFGEIAGEDMYEYFIMWDRSGRSTECTATLRALPEDKVDMRYYDANYEKMIFLFDDAMATADTFYGADTIEELSQHMDLCGILSRWDTWYMNGTNEQKSFIDERYHVLYDKAMKFNYPLFDGMDWTSSDRFTHFPKEDMDFTVSPMQYIAPEE